MDGSVEICHLEHAMWCCYSTMSYPQISHNRHTIACPWGQDIDGLMQERCNSIANTLELHLSCTNPLIWGLCCELEVWSMCYVGNFIAVTEPDHIDGLVQDCSISSVLAMEILQSCTKPSIYFHTICVSSVVMEDSLVAAIAWLGEFWFPGHTIWLINITLEDNTEKHLFKRVWFWWTVNHDQFRYHLGTKPMARH